MIARITGLVISLFVPQMALAETLKYEYSNKIDEYSVFQIQTTKSFTITKLDSALIALKKPIALSVTCDGNLLGQTNRFYEEKQLNKAQTLTLVVEVNSKTCDQKSVDITFISPGLTHQGTPMDPRISLSHLPDEGFVRFYDDNKEIYAQDLVSYSATLSQYGASQNTMYCIVDTYKKRPGMSGIIKELSTNYFNIYGIHYEDQVFPCPPEDNLTSKISECLENPRLTSPFCNTYKMYDITKSWFMDKYQESKSRKATIADIESAISQAMMRIQDEMKSEVQQSDDVLGTETDFEK